MKPLMLLMLLWPTFAWAKVDPKTVPGTVKWLCDNFERGFANAKFPGCKATGKSSDNAYHQCLEVANSGVGQKRLKFSAPQAKNCIAKQKLFVKDPTKESRKALLDACAESLKGTKAKGDACESPLDCVDGLACIGVKGGSPGKCVTPLPEGEGCDTELLGASVFIGILQEAHPVCAAGLYCSETPGKPRVCAPAGKVDGGFHELPVAPEC